MQRISYLCFTADPDGMKPLTAQEKRVIRKIMEEGSAAAETHGHRKTAPYRSAVSFAVSFAALVMLAWVLLKLVSAIFG